MGRAEFSSVTRREARARANGHCEAVGTLYGLPPGKRCNAVLGKRIEFDHILACSNGGDNSLTNAACICGVCHDYKTHHFDTPRAAKIVRQRDKSEGTAKPSSNPLPCGRNSKWKKPMGGGPAVLR